MEELIKIVVDTNICHSGENKNDFSRFSFGMKINTLKMWISYLDLVDKVRIVFPEIVIKELKRQKIDLYKRKKEEILNYKKENVFPDIKIIFDVDEEFDYEKYLEDVINSEFEENVHIENSMSCPLYLDKIIQRAVDKKPPFEGVEKKSDKGFKDAVIWESLLEYKEKNKEYTLVVYTNDKRFNDELLNEYREKFDDELLFFDKEDMLIGFLMAKSDKKEDVYYGCYKEYEKVYKFLNENLDTIKDEYKKHHFSGAWFECKNVEIISIKLQDLYVKKMITDETPSEYEAVFYVKSVLQDSFGELHFMNLQFIVRILYKDENDISLYGTGSGVGYMNYR